MISGLLDEGYFNTDETIILQELKIDGEEQEDEDGGDNFEISNDETPKEDETDNSNKPSESDNDEVSNEPTPTSDEDEGTEDNSEDEFSPEVENDSENDNDSTTEDNSNEGEDTEDEFSPDMDDNNSEDNDTNSDDENIGDDSSTDGDTSNEDDPSSKILDIEKDIYNSLTPEQQNIKNIELKSRFVDIYNSIGKLLERINDINNTDIEISKVLDRISNTLNELKTCIEDNLSNAYNTRGYIENLIVYQKYFTIYNAAGKVLEKINLSINIDNSENDDK